MRTKKLLALLLALGVFVGAMPMMSLTASAAIVLSDSYEPHTFVTGEAIDAENDHRNAGFIVKYTYGYDAKTYCPEDANDMIGNTTTKDWYEANCYTGANYTCTNQWGAEVAVNKFGLVIDKSAIGVGGNMAIPEGGYVLSAVNDNTAGTTEATTLVNNVNVGDYVVIKDNVYYVYRTTADSKFSGDGHSHTFNIPRSYALKITDGGAGVRTGTNEWNNDVLVKATGAGADGTANHAGYVVKFGGNNIEVPTGYYAISFAGQTMSDTGKYSYNGSYLFQQFAAPGTIVNIGTSEIYFRHDVASAKRAACLMAGTTNADVSDVYAYSAKTIVDDAETNFELVDIDRMNALYSNMTQIADAVQSMSTVEEMEPYMATLYQNYEELEMLEFEKRPVEMRAVWIRPLPNDGVQRTVAELDALLEEQILEQKALGYNQIFIEAFYNSCTVFPIPSTAGHKGLYYSQNPYLVPTNMTCGSAGLYGRNANLTEPYDMLARFIEICRENDVEPHIWWEVFYAGYQRTDPSLTDSLFDYSVIKQVLDSLNNGQTTYNYWLNESQNGSYYYGAETDSAHQYFLNPASDDVRTFLLNTFDHILKTYDAESFQLDYIRYPHTNSAKCFGYDASTLARFKQSSYYNASVHTDTYLQSYEGFYDADWVQFRANFVTTFIEQLRAKIADVNPSYYLTSSPGPDPADSKKNLMQDVEYWLQNDLIDILYPMAYGENVPGMVAPGLVANNPKHFVCIGTSAGYNSSAYEQRWLKEVRDAGADGIAGFGTIDSWRNYAWSESAITPTGNATKAASVYLSDVLLVRAAQMLKLGAITETNYNTVKAAVEDATTALRLYGVDSDEALTAINAVQAVADTLGTNPKAAMTADVNYIVKIRNNSHDAAKQATRLEMSNATMTVNGNKLVSDGDGFSYVAATETLLVTKDGVVLAGDLPATVTLIIADNVKSLEFNGVTLSNAAAIESTTALTIDLTGVNNIVGVLPEAITYIGTGEMHNGDTLVMCKGDLDGDEGLDSDDVRVFMQYSVRAKDLTDEEILVGDANGDSKVNTIDTRIFLDKLVNSL